MPIPNPKLNLTDTKYIYIYLNLLKKILSRSFQASTFLRCSVLRNTWHFVLENRVLNIHACMAFEVLKRKHECMTSHN